MTTVLDDYTARNAQELTVTKGQHVRILQRQLSNAPDWCLIRLLNDHHHHHHHSQASSSVDSSATKHIEGLVPASILKGSKSSSSSISTSHPPTPGAQKNEQGKIHPPTYRLNEQTKKMKQIKKERKRKSSCSFFLN